MSTICFAWFLSGSGPTWSAGVAGLQGVALVARLAPVAVAAGVARRAHARHGAVRVEVALAAEPEERGRT